MTNVKAEKLYPFLDERLITNATKGGTRDWLCISQCLAEKVNWKEIIPDQFYQRFGNRSTTALLLQPKLHQLADFIRSSEKPFQISLTLEGKISCGAEVTNKPHRSFFFSSRKIDLLDPALRELQEIIRGKSKYNIVDVVKDIFEECTKQDFPYATNWYCMEVTSAKIHFEN